MFLKSLEKVLLSKMWTVKKPFEKVYLNLFAYLLHYKMFYS